MTESALPAAVKDAATDRHYDRARPYYQELARFIDKSSLRQLMQAIRGAARVLRNSDHVTPEAKTALLDEVLSSWIRVCQVLVILSPVLAVQRKATFEDIGFFLADWDEKEGPQDRWITIMTSILDNVVSWFQDDIFSKKMGATLLQPHQDSFGQIERGTRFVGNDSAEGTRLGAGDEAFYSQGTQELLLSQSDFCGIAVGVPLRILR